MIYKEAIVIQGLRALERREFSTMQTTALLDEMGAGAKASIDTLAGHVLIMVDRGLIERICGVPWPYQYCPEGVLYGDVRMTWAGHKALDSQREVPFRSLRD